MIYQSPRNVRPAWQTGPKETRHNLINYTVEVISDADYPKPYRRKPSVRGVA